MNASIKMLSALVGCLLVTHMHAADDQKAVVVKKNGNKYKPYGSALKYVTPEKIWNRPHCMAFNPAGDTLAIGGRGAINVFGTNGDKALLQKWDTQDNPEFDAVWNICFFPNGKKWASGHWKGHVRIWDPEQKQAIMKKDVIKDGCITSLGFTDKELVITGIGSPVLLWDVEREKNPRQLSNENAYRAAVSSDKKSLVVNSKGGLFLWDYRAGKKMQQFSLPESLLADSIVYSPDGTFVACKYDSGHESGVVVCNPEKEKFIAHFAMEKVYARYQRGWCRRAPFYRDIAFNSSNKLLLADNDGYISAIGNLDNGQERDERLVVAKKYIKKGLTHFELNHAQECMFAAAYGKKIRLFKKDCAEHCDGEKQDDQKQTKGGKKHDKAEAPKG